MCTNLFASLIYGSQLEPQCESHPLGENRCTDI